MSYKPSLLDVTLNPLAPEWGDDRGCWAPIMKHACQTGFTCLFSTVNLLCEGSERHRLMTRGLTFNRKQFWSGSVSRLGHPQCHLQEVLRKGWRRRVRSSVTFHLLSSCSKCHFKSGERCLLDWVASHHTCQLAETSHLWLGDEAVLGCWTPACLRPVNVAGNMRQTSVSDCDRLSCLWNML